VWNTASRSVFVLLVAPTLAIAGNSLTEKCNVRNIHVEVETPPGPARSDMATLIETAFQDRGFQKTETREDADAFLTGSVRVVDKMQDGNSTFTAHLSAVLTDKAGNELWRKELKPYRKFNVIGTDRKTALGYRADELAKKLAKACNKGWPK